MKKIAASYMSFIYFILYLPIVVLIIYSFNNAHYSMIWHGFTLAWYQTLFSNGDLWVAALHSLIIGVLASSLASFIGLFAAISLYRYRFIGHSLSHGIIMMLIVLPDIVLGISLLVLFSLFKIHLGFLSLLLAHITFCIPFAAVVIYARITSLEDHLFEVALDLGASEVIIFKKIILPLLLPAVITAWLLSFTLSFDDVLISYFVSGPGFQILPLKIYAMVKHGVRPDVNALCAVMFFVTLILVLISHFFMRKKI